jgi:hypothetical protein
MPERSNVKMEKVESSNVDAMGHDGDDIMFIQYKSGGLYMFAGVGFDMYCSIKESPSIGKALNATGLKGTRI